MTTYILISGVLINQLIFVIYIFWKTKQEEKRKLELNQTQKQIFETLLPILTQYLNRIMARPPEFETEEPETFFCANCNTTQQSKVYVENDRLYLHCPNCHIDHPLI